MHFRASGLPRLVPCPGSRAVQKAYPDTSRYEAKEGTVAHAIAAQVLTTDQTIESYVGTTHDDVYVDQEMAHNVAIYVRECLNGVPGVTESALQTGYEGHTLTGTPDHWQFDAATGLLRILDLKFGYRWVEVYMNFQLLTYAVLVWEHILRKMPGAFDMFKNIELVVVQPRANHPAGPIRRWSFDAELIRNYRNQIFNAIGLSALAEPPVHTGPHCRDCRGLLRCHAAGEAAAAAIEYSGTAVHGEMTPEMLAVEIDMVDRASKMLIQRQTALEEMGLEMCKKGTQLHGWEVRSAPGSLAWNTNDDTTVLIGKAMKADLRQPVKSITPTQAIARKLLTEKQVKALATRKSGAPKLKRIDNARAKRILAQ